MTITDPVSDVERFHQEVFDMLGILAVSLLPKKGVTRDENQTQGSRSSSHVSTPCGVSPFSRETNASRAVRASPSG